MMQGASWETPYSHQSIKKKQSCTLPETIKSTNVLDILQPAREHRLKKRSNNCMGEIFGLVWADRSIVLQIELNRSANSHNKASRSNVPAWAILMHMWSFLPNLPLHKWLMHKRLQQGSCTFSVLELTLFMHVGMKRYAPLKRLLLMLFALAERHTIRFDSSTCAEKVALKTILTHDYSSVSYGIC